MVAASSPSESGDDGRVRVAPFTDGLQIAYRTGTVDERVLVEGLAAIDLDGENSWLRPGAIVLDVGAHIGTVTLRAALRVPDGKVFAVEASRDSHALLARNVELNRLRNVSTHHLALSDKRGRVRLHHDDDNWGHTITKPVTARGEDVRAIPLGAFFEENGIERCDAAKFNCEGAEFPILMSASVAELQRIDRMVIFYHLDLVDGRFSLNALQRHLGDAGFELRHASVWPQRGNIIATRVGAD